MTRPELRYAPIASALLVAALVAGCVTINVYFPEAAIQDLAERIEAQVERQAAATGAEEARIEHGHDHLLADAARSPSLVDQMWARIAAPLLAWTAPQVLAQASAGDGAAGVATPEVTNPAIRAIIDSRAARLADLNRFKKQKVIGEGNEGLVVARQLTELALRDRAAVQRLVKAENADREALYREIAAVKNVDLSQLGRIRETYAKTLRDKAQPGDLIQQPDGSWTEKRP